MADKLSQAMQSSHEDLDLLNSVDLPKKDSPKSSEDLVSSSLSMDDTHRLMSKLELLKNETQSQVNPKANVQSLVTKPLSRQVSPAAMFQEKPPLLFRVLDFLAKFIKRWEAKLFAALEQEPQKPAVVVPESELEEEDEDRLISRIDRAHKKTSIHKRMS
ncbi:MAG: hypothetical protein KDD62_06575 [Bdellovibrionales bacterium]|nr:hypothetical protein [Bdellovibrionales bacterium]